MHTSEVGADIQEEEQTFPTLQPLPSCPENSLSYGLSNIRYNIHSIVVSNTAKQVSLNWNKLADCILHSE